MRDVRGTNLLWTIPLSPAPFLIEKKLVVLVGEDGGGESPWTLEAGAVSVATSQSVSSRERNDLLVVEAHTAEDGAEMVLALGGVWKTTIRSA